ncbi:MAG TPA: hypothetical protein VNO30_39255 [Kofleriaceae bacterium]|nr:hypothetical protein [Kofleriaceae bacterium]
MQRLAWIVAALAACGGDDRVDDFVGSWTYQAGSITTLDCDNNNLDSMDMLTGTFMYTVGTSSDIIEPQAADEPCPALRLDVSGGTARAQSGQTCTQTVGVAPNTATIMASITSLTATLDSAGTKLTVQGESTSTVTGGITASCTATINGTAMKVSARTAGELRATWADALAGRLRSAGGVLE